MFEMRPSARLDLNKRRRQSRVLSEASFRNSRRLVILIPQSREKDPHILCFAVHPAEWSRSFGSAQDDNFFDS
jgi:hypothetical protein